MKYDVIIVGGGPAGSVAGINLADLKGRVLLLDRAQFPRVKPCGGGISYRVYDRFRYLTPVLRSVPTNLINRVVLESPAGEIVDTSDSEPLYAMVRRYEFDAALLQECKRRGVEVLENCTATNVDVRPDGVTITTSAGATLDCDLVIGADGVNSVVAIRSGLRDNWSDDCVAIDTTEESPYEQLTGPKDTMYVYYGFGNTYGYGYVFPKVNHINVGIGYVLSYYRAAVKSKPYENHQAFVSHLRREGVLTGSSDVSNFLTSLLPVGGPLKRISGDRVLVAGDAAGFVNGLTAEGIYYAMASGEHAGKAAAQAVRAGKFDAESLSSYDLACDTEMGYELSKSVVLQKRLLGHPGRIDKIVKLARNNPRLQLLFTRFAVGRISYGELKRTVIPRALPWYITYKVSKIWHKLRRS
jgi:geranylgeranyl reductase family protein